MRLFYEIEGHLYTPLMYSEGTDSMVVMNNTTGSVFTISMDNFNKKAKMIRQ